MLRNTLSRYRDAIVPQRRTFTLFEEYHSPHEVIATIYKYPFRHVVIDEFLPAEHYRAFAERFEKKFSAGLQEAASPDAFSRLDLYDLYSYLPEPTLEPPYGLFMSRSYQSMLQHALKRSFTADVFSTFHHHKPSVKDNYIHTDYAYAYFADEPLPNGMNAWYRQCSQFEPSPKGRPVVRAAAAIFFLNNPVWRQGMGGETGIYDAKRQDAFIRALAPRNNRLIAFEISPTSFHNFRLNRMTVRNSFAQWFHTTEADVSGRYPGRQPVGWDNLRRIEAKKRQIT